METTIRKFASALEKVPMSTCLKLAKKYIKEWGYKNKDAVIEDVATRLFDMLNDKQKYLDKDLVASYTKKHIDDIMYAVTDVFPELDEEIRALADDKKKSVKESRRTNMANKKLYESIMRDVSKIVKMHLK